MALFKTKRVDIEKSTLIKEVKKIANDPDSSFVIQRRGKIVIVTQDIKSYGKYIIELRTGIGHSIKISNVYLGYKNFYGGGSYRQHFHVDSSCNCCLGNIESDLKKYYNHGRYHIVFMMLIEFLNSFTREKFGYYCGRWEYSRLINRKKNEMRIISIKK